MENSQGMGITLPMRALARMGKRSQRRPEGNVATGCDNPGDAKPEFAGIIRQNPEK
jgi:hypothetical protein